MLSRNRFRAKQKDEVELTEDQKLAQHFNRLSDDVKVHKPNQVLVKDVTNKIIQYNAPAYSNLLASSAILDRSLFVTRIMKSSNRITVINMPPRTGKTMLLELSKHMLSIPKSYLFKRVSHYESINSLCRTTSTRMADAKAANYKDLEAVYKRIHETLTLIRESRPDAKVQAQECLEECQNYLGMINPKSVAEIELKDSAKRLFSNINRNLEKLLENSQEAKSGSKNLKKSAANYLENGFYRGGFEKFIVEDDPYFPEIFGMHPVIHISFLQSGKGTFSSVFSAVRRCVQTSFEEHSYLQEALMYRGDEQSMKDLERFKKYLNRPEDVTKADFEQSMTFLSRLLNDEFQQNCVILVDEYDAVFNAIVNRCPGAQDACEECLNQCYCFNKVNDIMKSFYTTLKQNKYVEKVLMVGILPTRVFTSSLRADENTILKNRYSEFFMMSEKEFVYLSLYFHHTTESIQNLHHKHKYFLLNTADSVYYKKYTFPALAELSGASFGHVGAGSSLMVFQKLMDTDGFKAYMETFVQGQAVTISEAASPVSEHTYMALLEITAENSQTLRVSDLACANINRFLLNIGYLCSDETDPNEFVVPNEEIKRNMMTLLDTFYINKCQRQMATFMEKYCAWVRCPKNIRSKMQALENALTDYLNTILECNHHRMLEEARFRDDIFRAFKEAKTLRAKQPFLAYCDREVPVKQKVVLDSAPRARTNTRTRAPANMSKASQVKVDKRATSHSPSIVTKLGRPKSADLCCELRGNESNKFISVINELKCKSVPYSEVKQNTELAGAIQQVLYFYLPLFEELKNSDAKGEKPDSCVITAILIMYDEKRRRVECKANKQPYPMIQPMCCVSE